MDWDFEITFLTLLTTLFFLVGTVLILFAGPTLTIVGIGLITLSAIVFVVDMVDIVGHWRRITNE